MYKKNINKKRGFTLLIAMMTTSLLLMVSFVVANVAAKQIIISSLNEESQHAFYNAESGIECAEYWDFEGGVSQFATSTAGSINCNGQTITTGSQTVAPPVSAPSVIGGGGIANATSTFSINFTKGCAIVRVGKQPNGNTTIDSRGYNTCISGAFRRVERGVQLTY